MEYRAVENDDFTSYSTFTVHILFYKPYLDTLKSIFASVVVETSRLNDSTKRYLGYSITHDGEVFDLDFGICNIRLNVVHDLYMP